MNLQEIKADIEKLQKKYIPYYDPTQRHFEVGDTAWILYDNMPTEVKIVEISDFNEYGSPGGYVFYWIQFKDVSKKEMIWENLKFKFWLYILRPIGFKQPKIPYKLGPGHGVLAGRNEAIYKTKEEALIDGYLYSLKFEIEDIMYDQGN